MSRVLVLGSLAGCVPRDANGYDILDTMMGHCADLPAQVGNDESTLRLAASHRPRVDVSHEQNNTESGCGGYVKRTGCNCE